MGEGAKGKTGKIQLMAGRKEPDPRKGITQFSVLCNLASAKQSLILFIDSFGSLNTKHGL